MREQETVGSMMRGWRQSHGMTLADMAARCGCSVSALSEYETGRARVPYHVLVGVPRALGLLPESFLAAAAREFGVLHVPADTPEAAIWAAVGALRGDS